MAKTSTKKVGGAGKGDKDKKEKKGKVKRVAFKKAPKDGHTDAMPEGFDFTKHLSLKKGDFDKTSTFLKHRAGEMKLRGVAMVEKADKMLVKAERVDKLGDDKTAKKVKRAERIKKQLGALISELEEAGIDLDAISLDD